MTVGANALKGELAQPAAQEETVGEAEMAKLAFARPRAVRRRQARRGQDEGLCGRGLPRMRELHAGAERDVLEVRYVRITTGCS